MQQVGLTIMPYEFPLPEVYMLNGGWPLIGKGDMPSTVPPCDRIHLDASYAWCGNEPGHRTLVWKWQHNLLCVAGFGPYWDKSEVMCAQCGLCHQQHFNGHLSKCGKRQTWRDRWNNAWPDAVRPIVLPWLHGADDEELRWYYRGMIPLGLWGIMQLMGQTIDWREVLVIRSKQLTKAARAILVLAVVVRPLDAASSHGMPPAIRRKPDLGSFLKPYLSRKRDRPDEPPRQRKRKS